MTVRDMMKMMEKEKRTSLPLDRVDILTTAGHVVDPNEPVANYAQSCVRFVLISSTIVGGRYCLDDRLSVCLLTG